MNEETTINILYLVKDYEYLGYTKKSIIEVLQTALVTEIVNLEIIEHDKRILFFNSILIKILSFHSGLILKTYQVFNKTFHSLS